MLESNDYYYAAVINYCSNWIIYHLWISALQRIVRQDDLATIVPQGEDLHLSQKYLTKVMGLNG